MPPTSPRSSAPARVFVAIWFARALGAALALAGLVPVVALLVVGSPQGRARISQEAHRAALQAGLDVKFNVELKYWPLRLQATDVVLASTDGGSPALQAAQLELRPRLFALLAGKVDFDEISLESARVRAVVRGNRIENLNFELPQSSGAPSGPLELPIHALSLTDTEIDADVQIPGLTARASVHALDADVQLGSGSEAGVFEIAARASRIGLSRDRVVDGVVKTDDDELCGLDARVRVSPKEILVRRLTLSGSTDESDAPASFAGCTLASDDLRAISTEVAHFAIALPQKEGDAPKVSGHIRAMVPLGLLKRLPSPPDVGGNVEFDGDVSYDAKGKLPTVSGTVRAHELRVGQFTFARGMETRVSIEDDVVRSPEVRVALAGGEVTVNDLEVRPTAEGVPLSAALHLRHLSFAELMKSLGVSAAPHVDWSLDQLDVVDIKGTASPLKIDGELSGSTSKFAVYDIETTAARKTRFVGFAAATMGAHLAVRSDEIRFEGLHARFGKSAIDGALVRLGFHQDLVVEIPKATLDLEGIGPIANIPFLGMAQVQVTVGGVFSDPTIKATASIAGFEFSGLPLGDIAHADVNFRGTTVQLANVKATKNKSTYTLPEATLEFGGKADFAMQAHMQAQGFVIRDFLGIFHFESDPRFLDYSGNSDVDTRMSVTVGGPEDLCGGGVIEVDAKAHLHDLVALGEHFEDGHVDMNYRWTDKAAGIEGAEILVRSASVHKLHPVGGSPAGAVIGSLNMARGGALAGRFTVEDLPIASMQKAEPWGPRVEGRITGRIDLGGTIDGYRTEGKVHLTPLHIAAETVPASDMHFLITQKPGAKPVGRTKCGGPIRPAFNPATYNPQEDQGEMVLDGSFFGGQVQMDALRMSRQQDALIRGDVRFRRFATAPWMGLRGSTAEDTSSAIQAELTGLLHLDRVVQNHYDKSVVRIVPESIRMRAGGADFELQTAGEEIAFANEQLTLPETRIVPGGPLKIPGGVSFEGTIAHAMHEPDLNLVLRVLPTNLAFLPLAFPRMSRSEGLIAGELTVRGSPSSPDVRGTLALTGGGFAITGMPSSLSDVNVKLVADGEELRVAEGRLKTLGGEIKAEGSIPLHGASAGHAELAIRAKNLRYSPNEGTHVALDANLNVDASLTEAGRKQLPRLTGEVLVTSAEYTKPFVLRPNLETRHEVDSYDPAEDTMALDIVVRTRSPIHIRNNLVTMSLAINNRGLNIVGTNKRFGARGQIDALPGGRATLFSNQFDIRQMAIAFDDATRFAPTMDATAITEFRRGISASSAGRQAASWKIQVHVFGPLDNPIFELQSEPALATEDITFLLAAGVTRAELDANAGVGALVEVASAAAGVDTAVKKVIPIDDFRFGSWYSPSTGRTEANLTIGQRLTDAISISGTQGLQGGGTRAAAEWRIGGQTSVQGSWDNLASAASGGINNLGIGFRYHFELE